MIYKYSILPEPVFSSKKEHVANSRKIVRGTAQYSSEQGKKMQTILSLSQLQYNRVSPNKVTKSKKNKWNINLVGQKKKIRNKKLKTKSKVCSQNFSRIEFLLAPRTIKLNGKKGQISSILCTSFSSSFTSCSLQTGSFHNVFL